MTLEAGTKLGPYEILSPLGAGGMGEVYRARDTRLDRDVAIKVLPSHLTSNIEFKQRFEREAKSISQLSHPNICTLHDVGNEDGVDFLVMELLEGDTLAQRLNKGCLPLEDVLRFGIEIASALDKAHRAGIVHRDLKPGNIMLTKSGAKLLDFGLAKHAPDQSGLSRAPDAVTITEPLTGKGTQSDRFLRLDRCNRLRHNDLRRFAIALKTAPSSAPLRPQELENTGKQDIPAVGASVSTQNRSV